MKTRSSNKWYILGMLTLMYALNHIDRQVMVILQGPIKAEFALTDTQLGLLTGLMFAAFYATLGIPVAIWADRGNRRNIIALALTIWSGMTALSGFAQNYMHLLLARIGVGIGEAGGTPPATSMIADIFPPKRRAFALGVYTTGISFGILVGFILGGYVAAKYGWRWAFFIAGTPGILVALLLYFTVKEPVRGQVENRVDEGDVPTLRETLSFFWSQRAMVSLLIGGVLVCISANAFLVGINNFLERVHNVPLMERGIAMGILMGGFGGVGAIVFGLLCDHLSAKDLRWRPWMILITGIIALPFIYWFLVAADTKTAYRFYVVPGTVGLLYASITYAAMQELAPLRMRAMASAIMLLCLTLLGIGLGPVIVGMLSDYFTPTYGTHAIKHALIVMLGFNVLSIIFYIDAARHYRQGVERANNQDR